MFSDSLRGRLAIGKYTRWASDLDEESMVALLWAIGEFAWRKEIILEVLEHYRSTIDSENDVNSMPFLRALTGIKTIADIEDGQRMHVDEVCKRIREAIEHLMFRK